MRFLVIMAHQRSGTHLLGGCLSSHPAFKYTGEIFYKKPARSSDAVQQAIARVACGGRPDVLCLDFKYNQITRYTMEWMARPEVKVIHLVRRNLLRLYFSGELHTWRGQHPDSQDVPTFQFKPEQFDAIRNEIEKYKRRWGWLTDLKLYYEDLTHDRQVDRLPDWASRMICLLAQVPHQPLTTPWEKAAPTDFMSYLDGVPDDLRQFYD